MFRSKANVAAADRAARPHHDLTVVHDGRTWSFWAMAPKPHTVWLTDGRGFLLWNVKSRCSERALTTLNVHSMPACNSWGTPVCDDESQRNSPRKLLGVSV